METTKKMQKLSIMVKGLWPIREPFSRGQFADQIEIHRYKYTILKDRKTHMYLVKNDDDEKVAIRIIFMDSLRSKIINKFIDLT